jgi:hypothetical protein
MREAVHNTVKQTFDQKLAQADANPSTLEADLELPLCFTLEDVLAVIKLYTRDDAKHEELGCSLELAVGSRSVDLLDDTILTVKVCQHDSTKVRLTGRSKHSQASAFDSNNQNYIEIVPVGLSPQEVCDVLARYRIPIEADREHIRAYNAVHLKQFEDRPRVHAQFLSRQLSRFYNRRLQNACMLAFPREQAVRKSTTGKNIGSHTLRALHVNCAYALHGNSSSMDVFMKNRLQHASYGSIPNYKRVKLVDTPPAETTDVSIAVLKRKSPTNLPRHRHIGLQHVTMKDREHNDVTFVRFEIVRHMSEEDKESRLVDAERMLTEKNVRLNGQNLKRLGVGSRIVNQYKKLKVSEPNSI